MTATPNLQRLRWFLQLMLVAALALACGEGMAQTGNASRGKTLFGDQGYGCSGCHGVPPDGRASLGANSPGTISNALHSVNDMINTYRGINFPTQDLQDIAAYLANPGVAPDRILTVQKSGTGSGTVTSSPAGINCGNTCSFSVPDKTNVTLTAVAAPGSVFVNWTDPCFGTSPCVVGMSFDRVVGAVFNAAATNNTLTVSVFGNGSGSVSSSIAGIACTTGTCTSPFLSTATVTLTATAVAGSTFTGWTGDCSGTGACQLPMSAAHSVTATFAVIPALAKRGGIDLDGTGKSALLVRSGAGTLQAGRLVGNQLVFTAMPDPGTSFRLVGVGDFDGNGKSDLAFQNIVQDPTFGDVRTWPNFTVASEVLWRQVKKVWDVQAVGDLDGDGFGDLVWRYVVTDSPDTGVSYIWFSNGGSVTQVRKRGGAPLTWKLLGAADLNGDGAADMIYISPDGIIKALMATPNRTCANVNAGNMPAGFTALKLADFTGNNRGDILVRNTTTGANQLLSLNGNGLSLPPYTGAPDDQNASCTASTLNVANTIITLPTADPTWQLYATGDFNGDGINDIVWLQPNGTLTLWLMAANGAAPAVIANAGSAPTAVTVFQP